MRREPELTVATRPMCSTPEQVIGWLTFARLAHRSRGLSTFCSDCTPEYQAEMIRQYRCSNPGHLFSGGEG